MKRQKAQHSNLGIFGKAVVTATLLGCSAIPHGGQAAQAPEITANGVYVTILSPTVDAANPSKPIEISAFYQASQITGGVTTLELYVDGQQEAVKKLDTPENRGVVSFVINPGTLTAGSHHIVVRVSSTDAEIASAKTSISVAQPITDDATPVPALGGDTATGSAPAVAIMTPGANSTVMGTVDIKVDAHDNSGKSPYVSLFVDHTFKTLRNFPPYNFAWDTTRVSNGYHTIEVWGYNDDQAVGHAEPLTVFVNNPGGRTLVRHDLLDTVPTKVLISETRPKQAAAAHHDARPVSLASGQSVGSTRIEKLASTATDENSSISEESQLMSPFITEITPATVHASAPTVAPHRAPSLAARTASVSGETSKQLSFALPEVATITNSTELITPSVESVVPDAVVYHAAPAAVHVKAVQQSAFAKAKPVQTASANITGLETAPNGVTADSNDPTYNMRLDASTSPVISDDQQGPALEAPQISTVRDDVKAALAAGKSAEGLMGGATKLASASIDSSSSIFKSGATLQTPQLPAQRIVNFVTTHHVATRLQPLGSSPSGFAPESVQRFQLVMNNKVVLLNQPLQDKSNLLFAPFRQIFENEGGVMSWNSASHTVHALSGSRDIELTIGSKSATVNQQAVTLNASPYIVSGHTMIPLAFVPLALDATVSYDPANGHIVINSKD